VEGITNIQRSFHTYKIILPIAKLTILNATELARVYKYFDDFYRHDLISIFISLSEFLYTLSPENKYWNYLKTAGWINTTFLSLS
jgi:hypothetical protein